MTIPVGYAQVMVTFGGIAVPHGAAIVFGVANPTPYSASDVGGLIDDAFLASDIMALFSSSVTTEEVRTKLGPDATGPFNLRAMGYAGEDTADAVPPNTSALVGKVTGLGGRQGRGRMFWPGVSEEDVTTSGVLSSAKVLALQTACDTFLDSLETNLVPMVILHGNSLTPTPVTKLSVSGVVATQRRRLRR